MSRGNGRCTQLNQLTNLYPELLLKRGVWIDDTSDINLMIKNEFMGYLIEPVVKISYPNVKIEIDGTKI